MKQVYGSPPDRIEGDKIILHDNTGPGPRIIKKVVIIKSSGEKREYKITKTPKSNYLFN